MSLPVRVTVEKLHLDRAIMASSAHELTYAPIHCQRCLQGLRIPAPVSESTRDQPARAPGRALALPTAGPAQAGQRNNHYGCPTIRNLKAGGPWTQ
jgi:hypothetical protein